MKEDIVLIGGGGHCRSVIEVIESEGKYNIAGIIDQKEKIGKDVLGYKIIGSDDDISEIIKSHPNFHITLGHIKTNVARIRLYNYLKSEGANLPYIVAANAYVSKHATINEGSIIMSKSFVSANAVIGGNCIINTNSIIEHDVKINDNCHISTGAIINGECEIKENCFIGSNATIIQGIIIEKNTIIGAGAVVTKNAEPHSVYVGNPAIIKRKN